MRPNVFGDEQFSIFPTLGNYAVYGSGELIPAAS
jgi:hypothetical protein